MNGASVFIMIIFLIVSIVAFAWVWIENTKDFNEIQQLTCDQYNLTPEACNSAIEEAERMNK